MGSAPATSSAPSTGAAAVVLRRWAPWVLIAIVVIAAGAVGLHRPSHPTLDQRTASVANQVRCPVCSGQTVNQSDTPPSQAIRGQIHSELAAGEAPRQVLAGIVASYGPGILEKPPTKGVSLIVWVAPIVVVAGAIVGLVLAFRRWRPARAGAGGVTVSDQRLVDEALSRPSTEPPADLAAAVPPPAVPPPAGPPAAEGRAW